MTLMDRLINEIKDVQHRLWKAEYVEELPPSAIPPHVSKMMGLINQHRPSPPTAHPVLARFKIGENFILDAWSVETTQPIIKDSTVANIVLAESVVFAVMTIIGPITQDVKRLIACGSEDLGGLVCEIITKGGARMRLNSASIEVTLTDDRYNMTVNSNTGLTLIPPFRSATASLSDYNKEAPAALQVNAEEARTFDTEKATEIDNIVTFLKDIL